MTEARAVSVYATAASLEDAERLADALVEERLVACVNILPGMRSVYRWEGRLEHDDEVVLLAKTRRELAEAVCERVAALHTYDVPCCVVLPLVAGWPAYLDWIDEQTREP